MCLEFKVLHSSPFLPYLFPAPSLGKPWALVTQPCSFQSHCGTFRSLCLEGLSRLSVCQLFHFEAVISKLKYFKEPSRKHISEVQMSLQSSGGPVRPLCSNAEETERDGAELSAQAHAGPLLLSLPVQCPLRRHAVYPKAYVLGFPRIKFQC